MNGHCQAMIEKKDRGATRWDFRASSKIGSNFEKDDRFKGEGYPSWNFDLRAERRQEARGEKLNFKISFLIFPNFQIVNHIRLLHA